jgi:hypothetical protein
VSGTVGGVYARIASTGDLVLGVGTQDTIDFGGGPIAGPGFSVLATLDSTMTTHRWSQRFPASVRTLALDAGDNLVLSGNLPYDPSRSEET